MFIIYIAHVPWNWWTLWIPARFGFSDATEIFVFCSGMASALAFGKVFETHGWGMGAARIVYRMWQVYWAHIGQFFIIAVSLVALHESGFLKSCCGLTEDYVGSLNLWHLFDNSRVTLPGLFSLTWVPNYFDILPMYIVILGLIPVMMFVARYSVPAAFACSIGLWLLANFGFLSLPAEPWSDRPWFFNPFAWQLVFFTGFAFMRGWLPAPPVNRGLVALAIAILLVTLPFAYFRIHLNVQWVDDVRNSIEPFWRKTEFGLFRYIHFLALAYLAWLAAGEHGRRLYGHGRKWGAFVRVVQKVGQQSLAVFMASLVIAQTAGILRDMVWGRGELIPQVLSNLLGFMALIAVAYTVSWFKGQPWRKPPARLQKPERPGKAAPEGGEPAKEPARRQTETV